MADIKLADNQEPPASFNVEIANSLVVTVEDVVVNQPSTLIAWTNRIGVTAEDGALIKTDATAGWGYGGAASVQSIPGDGAVEFTALETDSYRMLGLSNGNASASYDTIGYAIYVRNDGTVRVYENGTNRGDFGTYQSGDVLRVERTGSMVAYKRNGEVLYTSAVPSTGELIADAALHDLGARLDNARIIGAPAIALDTDSDGIPDEWEIANGLDPQNGDDGAQDLDSDGISNLEEYQRGADPTVMDVMPPIITPNGGTFTSSALVSITTGTGAESASVYYTLDGSTPTTGSAIYSGPFLLTESATVKAIAVLAGYTDSAVASAPFAIATSGTLIAWTDRIGVTAEDGALIKTDATAGWGYGGAASVQSIPGDGAVEFTALETDSYRMLGLSNGNASASYDTIGYAIYVRNDGTVRVYENGTNRGDFGTYQSGDVLRVERTGSMVAYKRNGEVLYTSAVPSTGELIADAALHDLGARLDNARISGN